jgi:hypothetical protein
MARNIADYRARRQVTPPPKGDFWISADGNFVDMAVLEWCKVLGDDRAEHGWRKILTEPHRFFAALPSDLAMDAAEWAGLVAEVRWYRDKFLAHLDSDLVMDVPVLDKALQAAGRYYRWTLDNELDPIHRGDIAARLEDFYSARLAEGESAYLAVTVSGPEATA